MMSPRLRKFALTAHLTFSGGWIGSVLVYLVLGIAAVRTQEDQTIRAAWRAMEIAGWYVIVPLALASLLTGTLMALGTNWGLFVHWWVLISFALTVFASVVLVLHMPSVSVMADAAQIAEGEELQALGGDLLHPGLGLVVLVIVQLLNMYKPQGLTRHGWRKKITARI